MSSTTFNGSISIDFIKDATTVDNVVIALSQIPGIQLPSAASSSFLVNRVHVSIPRPLAADLDVVVAIVPTGIKKDSEFAKFVQAPGGRLADFRTGTTTQSRLELSPDWPWGIDNQLKGAAPTKFEPALAIAFNPVGPKPWNASSIVVQVRLDVTLPAELGYLSPF